MPIRITRGGTAAPLKAEDATDGVLLINVADEVGFIAEDHWVGFSLDASGGAVVTVSDVDADDYYVIAPDAEIAISGAPLADEKTPTPGTK